jgi:hypothetical protein
MPRLRVLHHVNHVDRFLVPSVTNLHCSFSIGVLHCLIMQRPWLWRLSIVFSSNLRRHELLVPVIEQLPAPQLAKLRLLGRLYTKQPVVDTLFRHLTCRDGLKALTFQLGTPSELVLPRPGAIACSPSLFKHLEDLEAEVHSDSVQALISNLPPLSCLSLTIKGSGNISP